MTSQTLDPTRHADSITQLHHVAGLLLGAGYADPATVDPGVALLCLAAVDELRPLGVHPSRVLINGDQVTGAVDDALAGLADLPPEVFAVSAVLDAAGYVRAARALLAERT